MKAIIMAVIFMTAFTLMSKDLQVLMIGNSFSISVLKHLPPIVRSAGKDRLYITSAYIGGCSLKQHSENLAKADADPAFKPYLVTAADTASDSPIPRRAGNVQKLLSERKWDIVTIQQASHESWNIESYSPYAAILIEKIRSLAPQAEIVIQQTWSYRCDDPRIGGSKREWGFDQTGMYERVQSAYAKLAGEYGFRQIPTGKAVQLFRSNSDNHFEICPPKELSSFRYPDLPRQSGDVVGRFFWHKRDGEMHIGADTIHLNNVGEYLQGCVWYLALFGNRPESIKYVPDFIGDADAALLIQCASKAVDSSGPK